MLITQNRTNIILQGLQDKHWAECCSNYGERGYTDPEKSIVFADWNNISKLTQDYLAQAGFELEWSDEWYIDYNNDKAWRTQGDSYSWVCSLGYGDGYVLTPDDDLTEWFELVEITDYMQRISALPDFINQSDLIENGYLKYNGNFENGFHVGQNDDPQKIARQLFETIENIESVIFRIDSTGQFDVTFQAYYKLQELD